MRCSSQHMYVLQSEADRFIRSGSLEGTSLSSHACAKPRSMLGVPNHLSVLHVLYVQHSVRVYALYRGVVVKIRSPHNTLSIVAAYLLCSHHIRHIPFGMQYLVLGSISPMGHISTVFALQQLKFIPIFRFIHIWLFV